MKRIALVYDTDGWCWHYRAIAIKKYAPDCYEVDIFRGDQFDPIEIASRYDGVLFFSWNESPVVGANKHTKTTVMAASTAMMLPDGEVGTTRNRNCGNATERLPHPNNGVICVNRRLQKFCSQYNRAIYLVAGVDTEVFRPKILKCLDGPLRIGWCGQERGTTKGYEEVLVPLMRSLPNFDWRVNRNNPDDARGQREMADWFADLDVFLCTSSHEGGPMTVLEAAACGAAIVTTPAGDMLEYGSFHHVPGWAGGGNPSCTVAAMRRVLLDIDRLNRETGGEHVANLGDQCRREIEEKANWATLAPKWLAFVVGEEV